MYWEDLLKEVLNKAKEGQTIAFKQGNVRGKTAKKFEKIFLGLDFKDVYFTSREAEVMVQLLQGKTLIAAAEVLSLSPRTIEFYVKNMKAKLACRTKSELIGKVFASDFIKNVDFIAGLMNKE